MSYVPKVSRSPQSVVSTTLEDVHPFENINRAETNLCIRPIDSLLQAPGIFGTKTANGATPIVLTPARKTLSVWASVPEGCAALVTRYGKFMGVFKSGYHWFPGWYHVQYLVNTQHIPYHFHIKECPTRDNVQIKIHVDILFHVVDPVAFVYDIGPEKLEELLRASQAESVRSLVRNRKVSEAYDLRGQEGEDMVNSLNDKIKPYGVVVDYITIANVTLPASIAVAMQSETTFESKQTEQRKKQEYELKVLNDNNYLLRVKQDRENERRKATEEAKRSLAFITQDIQTLEANMTKLFSEIGASQESEVNKLTAEGKFEAAKITAEKDKQVSSVRAKGESEVNRMRVETDKYVRQVKAEAKVLAAENNAHGLEVLGEAEQKAADKLQVRRKFDLDMESIEIWNHLARNSNALITSGTSAESALGAQVFGMQQISNLVNATVNPAVQPTRALK